MPDLGIGSIIGGVASLAGGLLSGKASKQAAQTQAQAGEASIAEQQREFDIGQQNLLPYRQAGQQALSTLSDYLGISPAGAAAAAGPAPLEPGGAIPRGAMDLGTWASKNLPGYVPPGEGVNWTLDQQQQMYNAGYGDYLNKYAQQYPGSVPPAPTGGSLLKPFSFDISKDPGYQFRLGQGEQAITNRASATGGVSGSGDLSGATLKELLRYGQDYASGEYNAAFQRDQATKAQEYGMLTGVSGMGQGATTTGVQAGQQTAASIGNTLTGIGNAQAAGQVGQANALGGALGNVGSGVNQALLLKSIINPNPGVTAVNQGVQLGGIDPSLMAG